MSNVEQVKDRTNEFKWNMLAHSDARWAELAISSLDAARERLVNVVKCSIELRDIAASNVLSGRTDNAMDVEDTLRNESLRNISEFQSIMDDFCTREQYVKSVEGIKLKDMDIYCEPAFKCAVMRCGIPELKYEYGTLTSGDETTYMRRRVYGRILPDGSFVRESADEWMEIASADFLDENRSRNVS